MPIVYVSTFNIDRLLQIDTYHSLMKSGFLSFFFFFHISFRFPFFFPIKYGIRYVHM